MFQGKRIACISDIHLGVHQDSQMWQEQHLELARWLKESLIKNSITDIIIAGDIFHNRHEIGVSTLHAAREFFNILSSFNIVAITGNHDCYYRDNSKINSIKVLDREGFTIVDECVHTVDVFNRKVAFCPWGTEIDEIPSCDVVVGHFEINNFKMNMNHSCDDGWDSTSLLSKCHKVITGHFHLRDERVYQEGKTILYLGSPLELDWSDRGSVKGYTIINLEDLSLSFIENTISPQHIKVCISDLQSGKVTIQQLKNLIYNNYVKIVVDVTFTEASIDSLLLKLGNLKPKQLKVEYDIPADRSVDSEVHNEEKLVSIVQVMKEYVEVLETDISKKDILNKCMELYQRFQNTNE